MVFLIQCRFCFCFRPSRTLVWVFLIHLLLILCILYLPMALYLNSNTQELGSSRICCSMLMKPRDQEQQTSWERLETGHRNSHMSNLSRGRVHKEECVWETLELGWGSILEEICECKQIQQEPEQTQESPVA